MSGRIERTYGRLLKYVRTAVNPFKNVVVITECIVHQFINVQALEILKNDEYTDAHNFFSDYLTELNAGVVWADRDLKSMGHFYNPHRGRGLYGNKDAVTLAVEYYHKALYYWKMGLVESAMFYLGAAVHLVQDVTIPQHANIKLLGQHKKYENFIRRTYMQMPVYWADRGGYYYMRNISEVVTNNARNALKIYARMKSIENEEERFIAITKFILPLAQKSTAGCFMMFYREVGRHGQEAGPHS